jgi:hypothetical protein
MACLICVLLTTTLFRVPTDPGPVAVYYPTLVKIVDVNGTPVLDAIGQCMDIVPTSISHTEQARINAHFNCARNYWLSYMNIQHACYNDLGDNIDNVFKVSNDLALVG